ncbi:MULTISPECIES: response regulator transcription factor [Lysinibacillus]|jgi:DNA-binding response OmpR family regulator|uniref:DNA-binding response regulator n=1 Tax=Lysinibacillus fusiformis TaxID=28031 RepID=A0A2I0UV33_9BACI|nr:MULTISPECIES: response regulator transcription factor [Lysinibacillus]KUF36094.1 XRE family transcriptional regulator [Lysinibacillus sp. F5]MEE3809387.1 response regulator transcription factor [Lysinibacillus fusiformis]PKU49878.1 DNA-binding response regulator [Lysinibacillus fusiformis]WCH47349.1 response regulator transcription factor [Lysinibacillus sp. OF-1]SCY97378.1 DNA-binding response regulator, OmpR family, contains REC and winged-helix (wHTH) domain [Lysinibacillus sp. SG9]
MKTILCIDDEPRMLDLLTLYLEPNFYCRAMSSVQEAFDFLEDGHADLILLDVMMPEMDGWQACQEIRKFWDVPIIMLTAKGEHADIVKGLNLGADDYILKPFDEEELLARIYAVLRRSKIEEKVISFEGLRLDKESFELYFQHEAIPLTPKEFSMLVLFLDHQNKVFSREHLITTVWGYNVTIEDRTIDSHVRNLREKLRKSGFPADDYLQTVWGIGYKWHKSIDRKPLQHKS